MWALVLKLVLRANVYIYNIYLCTYTKCSQALCICMCIDFVVAPCVAVGWVLLWAKLNWKFKWIEEKLGYSYSCCFLAHTSLSSIWIYMRDARRDALRRLLLLYNTEIRDEAKWILDPSCALSSLLSSGKIAKSARDIVKKALQLELAPAKFT